MGKDVLPGFDSPELKAAMQEAVEMVKRIRPVDADEIKKQDLPKVKKLEIEHTWMKAGVMYARGTIIYADGRKEWHDGPIRPIIKDGQLVGYAFGNPPAGEEEGANDKE